MDPRQAAAWHCDRHVVKMLLESTQLLWTAWHLLSSGENVTDRTRLLETAPRALSSGKPGYRPTHKNHPCAVWVRASTANYRWLVALARALAEEYHFRWPAAAEQQRPHACEAHVEWLATHEPMGLPIGPLTWPALAMPAEYKISQSPTACYKAYYLGQKREQGLLVYTRRARPAWC